MRKGPFKFVLPPNLLFPLKTSSKFHKLRAKQRTNKHSTITTLNFARVQYCCCATKNLSIFSRKKYFVKSFAFCLLWSYPNFRVATEFSRAVRDCSHFRNFEEFSQELWRNSNLNLEQQFVSCFKKNVYLKVYCFVNYQV